MHVSMYINHNGMHNNYYNIKRAILVVQMTCHNKRFARTPNQQTHKNKIRTRRKVQHKRQQSRMSTLPSMQITMLATFINQYQQPYSFSVDTDGVYFMIDNSANGGICNIKSMFVGDFERQIVTLVTAYGRTTTVKLVGTLRLVLKDDARKTWSYDIPDVVYDPELPYSLLGISFLGNYFARNDEANKFDEQTWIQSA
jgi:hypothetical protein